MSAEALPWRVEPAAGAGFDVINANGEQVALFEEEHDARATVERMNRDWIAAQDWFRTVVKEAVAAEG